jgi:hypothetical protein
LGDAVRAPLPDLIARLLAHFLHYPVVPDNPTQLPFVDITG